jgi:prepilin-type N-terminal cleavage/methylation domain-containing protein
MKFSPLTKAALPRCHGFTLMEIMMVVAIGLVVLATGLPPFVRGMKKEGLRRAVSDLVEACSHARAQAILKGKPVELTIRSEDGLISVGALRTSSGQESGLSETFQHGPGVSSTEVSAFSAHLPEQVAFKLIYVNFVDMSPYPEARVRFFPNGTSDEFTVILYAETGEQKISLDVVTAVADVEVLR